jgi:hypothetical protein
MKNYLYVFLIILSSFAYAQDAYLCLPKNATGFSYLQNSKSWEISTFNVSDNKYLLKNKSGKWFWDKFGRDFPNSCNEFNQRITCNLFVGEVIFDKKTLRYIRTYVTGYVDGVTNNDNTPLIEIGTCSPL